MRYISALLILLGSLGLAEEKAPDIISLPADLNDYYVFKNGKWIWREDLKPKKTKPKKHLKGIVTLGKTTIRYIPDPPTQPTSKGN